MANRVLRVLNLEDNAIKHSKIARVIKRIGEANIDWVRNLEDGMELIESSLQSDEKYDFIISDMWYPLYSGGADHGSGDELIKNLQLQRIAIPVIICSTIQYNYAGSSNVIGAVQCQDSLDWETVLEQLLKSAII